MATTLKKPSNTKPRRSPNVRMIQNFHLVWLDGSIDEENDDDYRNCIIKLRQVVNTVNTFIDVDECIDFITDINDAMTSIIVSEEFIQIIIPIVQEIPQVSSVYIFSGNKTQHAQSAKKCSKVKGVFTDITLICEALKQDAYDCDHNSVSISFVQKADESSNENLDTLDQSFMYTQILKEILITIDFKQSHINDFLSYCRIELAGNPIELRNVEKLSKEYHNRQPIWWYTYQSFLYSMLNRALRLMEVDRIVKIGFFVRDLHQHIVKLHAEQYDGQHHSNSFTVYRGQGLSQIDFDQLKNTRGGLLAFNNFLSTSKDNHVSLRFARRTMATSDLIGVVFVMKIDPTISATSFANIKAVSCYQKEEEILFSMHSVFRIGKVQPIEGNSRLYQVDLTLTSDNDPQLHALANSMQKETAGSTGWQKLGMLMIKLGQFNQAEELYNQLFKGTNKDDQKAHLYHHLGMVKDNQGIYAQAVQFYEKALEIRQKYLPENHPSAANSYNSIGLVYDKMGEYSKAISYYEKALKIFQKTLPANHPDFATSYNNIGSMYHKIGEYSKALSYYEKALKIFQKTLPANHSDLATCYNNIGSMYDKIREYSKALSYYLKSLEIFQKTLPGNHPSLAASYNNIGVVYQNMGEYSKALSYNEKALQINQKTLPANHPDLATFYNNIGSMYHKIGEYSKALSYYEKALEIYQKTLPANHPDLAQSYNNIGVVYYNTGEYSKAISYYEKALEIFQKTLPANHPSLATSYSNIGSMYDKIREYSKALSYNETALEIFQKTLPANHPDLATSYNNIGGVYYNMREYSKAHSYYSKAIEIYQKTLTANHPSWATSYNNIGWVYHNKGDYSKALSYFERALDIWKRALPSNHPQLKAVKENIEILKKKL